MTTPKRRIRRGKITHVSLCRRAMNQLPVMMKSGNRMQIELLTKVQPEGLLHALVYVPETVDAEGDVASALAIKQIAHDFLANAAEVGGGVDIEHNLQVLGPDKVRIAETFIVQKNDPRFQGWKDYQGRPVDAEGSWALILKILDPELRKLAEAGELNGVSMFGNAEVELLNKTTPTTTNTRHMDEKQMQALCEMLTKSLAAALKPAAPPTPTPTPVKETIAFEGDPLNPEDLAKHMDKVLFASLDLGKPADLAKWQGHVAKRQAEIAKAAAAADTPEAKLAAAQDELKKAQEKLAKLQKASGAPADSITNPSTNPTVGLSKGEQDQMKAGRDAMRKFQGTVVNKK